LQLILHLLVLAAFSDLFAEALLIWAFWKKRGESWVGWYWPAAVAGVFLESLLTLLAMLSLSGGNALEIAGDAVMLRLLGRSAKTFGMWAMALKVLRGNKST
jgi:hypothetical protein